MATKPQAVECWQCGHPLGWHPNVDARNPMGCLECSCDLNCAEAMPVTVQPIEPAPTGDK